jgi:low affinity Fe/Cu permease
MGRKMKQPGVAERFARAGSRFSGSTPAFTTAAAVLVLWALAGPVFHFSDTWQLVINTGTTIVTFLMVFLIQRAQNSDSRAVHLKLNEIVAALNGASNRLVNVEDLSENELDLLHRYYKTLASLAKRDRDLGQSHTVEEAEARHEDKRLAAKRSSGLRR